MYSRCAKRPRLSRDRPAPLPSHQPDNDIYMVDDLHQYVWRERDRSCIGTMRPLYPSTCAFPIAIETPPSTSKLPVPRRLSSSPTADQMRHIPRVVMVNEWSHPCKKLDMKCLPDAVWCYVYRYLSMTELMDMTTVSRSIYSQLTKQVAGQMFMIQTVLKLFETALSHRTWSISHKWSWLHAQWRSVLPLKQILNGTVPTVWYVDQMSNTRQHEPCLPTYPYMYSYVSRCLRRWNASPDTLVRFQCFLRRLYPQH